LTFSCCHLRREVEPLPRLAQLVLKSPLLCPQARHRIAAAKSELESTKLNVSSMSLCDSQRQRRWLRPATATMRPCVHAQVILGHPLARRRSNDRPASARSLSRDAHLNFARAARPIASFIPCERPAALEQPAHCSIPSVSEAGPSLSSRTTRSAKRGKRQRTAPAAGPCNDLKTSKALNHTRGIDAGAHDGGAGRRALAPSLLESSAVL